MHKKKRGIIYLVRCPYPGCNHAGGTITNVHSKQFHNMPKKELFEKYGKPHFIDFDPYAYNQNRKMRKP